MSVPYTQTQAPETVVGTLTRFMRTNYGDEAEVQAERHAMAFHRANQLYLANVWQGVLEALRSGDK